jgi:hypothetical protein
MKESDSWFFMQLIPLQRGLLRAHHGCSGFDERPERGGGRCVGAGFRALHRHVVLFLAAVRHQKERRIVFRRQLGGAEQLECSLPIA